jgi:hypothetical protein
MSAFGHKADMLKALTNVRFCYGLSNTVWCEAADAEDSATSTLRIIAIYRAHGEAPKECIHRVLRLCLCVQSEIQSDFGLSNGRS